MYIQTDKHHTNELLLKHMTSSLTYVCISNISKETNKHEALL